MSAGVRMLIDRAGLAHLGAGPAVALLGGAALPPLALGGGLVLIMAGMVVAERMLMAAPSAAL